MHPRFSCAPVYLMQLLEQNLPASLLQHESAAFWLQLQTTIAPTLILLVEFAVPVLLLLEVRAGVAFAALFHWYECPEKSKIIMLVVESDIFVLHFILCKHLISISSLGWYARVLFFNFCVAKQLS